MWKVVTTFVVKGRKKIKILLSSPSPRSSPIGPDPKSKSKALNLRFFGSFHLRGIHRDEVNPNSIEGVHDHIDHNSFKNPIGTCDFTKIKWVTSHQPITFEGSELE